MKSVRLRWEHEERYFVGPLARLLINNRFSTPRATALLGVFHEKTASGCSALDCIEARLIEMIHCAERISHCAFSMPDSGEVRLEVKPRAGRYTAIIEAPRGLLVHDYTTDDDGRLTKANLVVATQNNYDAINAAITALTGAHAGRGDDAHTLMSAEFALRCFDPCLACATHAVGRMPLSIDMYRKGNLLRTITRRNGS